MSESPIRTRLVRRARTIFGDAAVMQARDRVARGAVVGAVVSRGVLRPLSRLGVSVHPREQVVQLLLPKCEGGLGDFLRGSIFAHALCRERGYVFQVDASRHPVGACLETPVVVDPAGAPVVDVAVPGFAPPRLCRTKWDVLRTIPLRSGAAVIHSVMKPPNWAWNVLDAQRPLVVAPETRELLCRFLTPTTALKVHVDARCASFGSSYMGLHIRCGDGPMMHGERTDPGVLRLAEDAATRHLQAGRTVFACSDNVEVLARLREWKHPRLHVSSTSRPINVHRHMSAEDSAHDAMVDLFLLLRASHVESYSVYGWGSGFVQWPCLITGVPFHLNVLGAVSCGPAGRR